MKLNISIIITTKGYSDHLEKTIRSIEAQRLMPYEIILVSNNNFFKKIKYNKNLKIKYIYCKIKNQVFQRNRGIDKLSKKSDIILQLDDRIILEKNCLHQLTKCWLKADENTSGIGLNQIRAIKETGLSDKLLKFTNLQGKVFKNGLNLNYINISKNIEVMWLKGGLSSWKISKNKRIKNRKYPKWGWCVFEDVDYSLSKKSTEKLLVCSKAKVLIQEQNNKNLYECFHRGSLHSFAQKIIVKKHFNKLFYYNLTIPFIIIISLIISLITFNFNKLFYSLGRLKGIILKYE